MDPNFFGLTTSSSGPTSEIPENERMSPENQWLVQMYFLLIFCLFWGDMSIYIMPPFINEQKIYLKFKNCFMRKKHLKFKVIVDKKEAAHLEFMFFSGKKKRWKTKRKSLTIFRHCFRGLRN